MKCTQNHLGIGWIHKYSFSFMVTSKKMLRMSAARTSRIIENVSKGIPVISTIMTKATIHPIHRILIISVAGLSNILLIWSKDLAFIVSNLE